MQPALTSTATFSASISASPFPILKQLTLYIEVEGIAELHAKLQQHGVKITMPMKDQFYGMREFAFEAPEGWVVTFAERIEK